MHIAVIGAGPTGMTAAYRLRQAGRPPIVLAGDWTDRACVEGAVRSCEAAAAVFG